MSTHESHIHNHNYLADDPRIRQNERKTFFVILLTAVTMIAEIIFGYITGSMALLADGWHMASHVGALGVAFIAYRLARSRRIQSKFTFGTGKFIPLGGYTSSLLLGIVAVFMFVESLHRYLDPELVNFDTALMVSWIGLFVNLLSAYILHEKQPPHAHEHGHNYDDAHIHHIHDPNQHGAFMHVLADTLTSVLAIIALALGKYFGWNWADPIIGIVGSIVILKWAYGLAKVTMTELLDAESKVVTEKQIRDLFKDNVNVEVTDIHVWKLAPQIHACEVMICTSEIRGCDFYRQRILDKFELQHLIVEERFCGTIGRS